MMWMHVKISDLINDMVVCYYKCNYSQSRGLLSYKTLFITWRLVIINDLNYDEDDCYKNDFILDVVACNHL